MKRALLVLLVLLSLSTADCATSALRAPPSRDQVNAFYKAMDGWLLRTDYGIKEYTYSVEYNSVNIKFKADMYNKLSDKDKRDIWLAISQLLDETVGAEGFGMTYAIDTSGTGSASPPPK